MKKNRKFNRVLHLNRYFIWAIALLFISGSTLIAYIYISSYNYDFVSVYPAFAIKKTFVDKSNGYSVAYPASWQLEKDQAGNAVFENPADLSQSITVTATALKYEKVIRASLKIANEYDYFRNGIQVNIISTAGPKNVPDISIALVKTSTKLYYISGRSHFFSNFVTGFKPL